MGYKLSYGLYIGKWVYPAHEALTIYPQRGSSMCILHTRPLLYTLNVVPQCAPFTRDPQYIPSTWFLNVYPPTETPTRDPNYIPLPRSLTVNP